MRSYRHWLKLLAMAWVAGFGFLVVAGTAVGAYLYTNRPELVSFGPVDHRSGDAWYDAGMRHHHAGRYDRAIGAFERSLRKGHNPDASAYNIACGYALKGDRDAAFEWLEEARELGFELESYLDRDSDLDSLRDDPRMHRLRAELAHGIGPSHFRFHFGPNFSWATSHPQVVRVDCRRCVAEDDWVAQVRNLVTRWVSEVRANLA